MRKKLAVPTLLAAALLFIVLLGGATGADAADDNDVVLPVTHHVWNGVIGVAADSTSGSIGVSSIVNPPSPICTSTAPNTDCEGPAPHNETAIAVNPTNTSNIIGNANDYQLRLSPGGTVYETVLTRAHVSFDGGSHWAMYPIAYPDYTSTGDPGIAFDADGKAYLSTLGFRWSQNRFCCTNPDILVSTSSDGGKTWSFPNRVASGTGTFGSPGILNDKEAITAWGHGNAIVTWTIFNQGFRGSYISSPIYDSVTHNGGKTWSAPQQISGSASFCAGAQGGTACNQDQGSVPVVAADGSIYVSFLNYSNDPAGRDQYLVAKVNPTTGALAAGPYKVAGLVDGFHDFPISIDGLPTYQDSEFRTWAFGNIAADPTNAQHLAVVWSDMRNSTLPAPADPYSATTNSDIVVSQSFDGGQTWSSPTALARANDQFMPWSAYDSSGHLQIGFFDRSYDSANHKYGYTLASEASLGSLTFTTTQLTTALSDPTKNDRWFAGRTPNAAFPHPTTFLGDYSGIATSSAGVAALWTDMTLDATFAGVTRKGEDAFYASH
jgi:hypothetical protein